MIPPASPPPSHAPEVGWAKKLLGDFHVTGLFWYRFLRWTIKNTPEAAIAPLVGFFTAFFFCTIWKIRSAIASNTEAVLGPAKWLGRQRRIWRTMHAFAWCLAERFERLATDRKFDCETEHLEYWNASLERGGLLMITAHLGLYEVGSMIPAGTHVPKVHLVREPEADPRAQRFIEESVAGVQNANYTMHFQTGDPLFALQLIEALERGEAVAIQGDRPRAGGKTVTVELFNRPLELPAGPAFLARAAKVPILPVFAIRVGRRTFKMVFRKPIYVAQTRNRDEDIRVAVQQIAADIEYAVRRVPEQWFVFRSLWD